MFKDFVLCTTKYKQTPHVLSPIFDSLLPILYKSAESEETSLACVSIETLYIIAGLCDGECLEGENLEAVFTLLETKLLSKKSHVSMVCNKGLVSLAPVVLQRVKLSAVTFVNKISGLVIEREELEILSYALSCLLNTRHELFKIIWSQLIAASAGKASNKDNLLIMLKSLRNGARGLTKVLL